jgi:GTPase SAR1 family protein
MPKKHGVKKVSKSTVTEIISPKQPKPHISNKNISRTDQRNSIRVALIGCVSSGKSTLLNSICVNQYEDMKRKRTTMLPSVYRGSNKKIYDNKSEVTRIQSKNKECNDRLYSTCGGTLTYENCSIQEHIIPMIKGFVDLPEDVFIDIYDIPGLNDAKTKLIYHKWVRENFHDFDIIINVVDINSGLNTSDETDNINLISECIQKEQTEHNRDVFFLTAINKCDDMDMEQGVPTLIDEEDLEIYKQIVCATKDILVPKKIKQFGFSPITSRDTYIYRMLHNDPTVELDMSLLNQFGLNEIGRTKWSRMSIEKKREFIDNYFEDIDADDIESTLELTGYVNFRNEISGYLTNETQSVILTSRVRCELEKDEYLNRNITKDIREMKDLVSIYNDYCIKVSTIDRIYNTNNSHLVTDLISKHINRWINEISDLSNDKEESIKRLDEYKGIMKMLKKTIDTYALHNKIKMIIPNDKYQRWQDSFGDQVSSTFFSSVTWLTAVAGKRDFPTLSNILDSLYDGYSKLQNDYYQKQLQDNSNMVDFPNNILSIVDKLKENRCDNIEEHLDKVITMVQNRINDFGITYEKFDAVINGPLSGYIPCKNNRVKVFCEQLLNKYDYPRGKVQEFIEFYIKNIYIIYEHNKSAVLITITDEGNTSVGCINEAIDPLKHNLLMAYPTILDDYLMNHKPQYGTRFLMNLKIINRSYIQPCLDIHIDYYEYLDDVLCLPMFLESLIDQGVDYKTADEDDEYS